MKQYTHAWIAFKAVERLETVPMPEEDRAHADSFVRWAKGRKDGVIIGAWYPDSVIKDNAKSHVMKHTPAPGSGGAPFRALPAVMRLRAIGAGSALYQLPYALDPDTNLPERCEALSHSVIDNLRVQQTEPKGSPIAPTDNHLALILFMLSHYVADAHMPFHCDSRQFSDGADLHGKIEGLWEHEVRDHFEIDYRNERFFYNRDSYPLRRDKLGYSDTVLKAAEDELAGRAFASGWGSDNGSVLEYMQAVCQYSYLASYSFIPPQYDHTSVTLDTWQALEGQQLPYQEMSVAAIADAVDSVARIWFRVWRRYALWLKDRLAPPPEGAPSDGGV
jgi:hypothetical protein